MRSELRELHQRLGVTSIYVTHDQIEAMTMADRIIVLRDGRVEQAGCPLDLFDRPVNAFVAGFIGSPAMNFLPGTLEGGGLRLRDGTLLGVPPPSGLAPGRQVTLGIRPEHLALRRAGDGGLPAKVRVTEPTGSETMMVTQAAGQPLTVLARERVLAGSGDEVSLHPDGAHAHWFDEAGQRVGA
jgi:multiple sugar transport system ATP-binding protein